MVSEELRIMLVEVTDMALLSLPHYSWCFIETLDQMYSMYSISTDICTTKITLACLNIDLACNCLNSD